MLLTCCCITEKIELVLFMYPLLLISWLRQNFSAPISLSSNSLRLFFPFLYFLSIPSVCWVLYRMRCFPSRSSPGHGWGGAFWMVAPSERGGSLFWRECQLSSMAPCIAARPRIPWAPRIRTLVS